MTRAWRTGFAAALSFLALGAAPGLATVCNLPIQFDLPISKLTGPNPVFVAVGDFNHDGLPDLAVTNSSFPSVPPTCDVAVLLATGPFTYAAPVLYPVGSVPLAILTADFNGDGILDLVVANKFSNAISVLPGQGSAGVGDGTFGLATSYSTGGRPFQMVRRDFNGDGIADLAVALNNLPAVALMLGQGSAGVGNGAFALSTLQPLNNLGLGIAAGDFNADGIADLAATEYSSGTIAILLGNGSAGIGDGTFAPAVHYPAGPVPTHIAVDDFNADGVLDLAVANAAGGGTAILLGQGAPHAGNGTFSPPTMLPTGNTSAVATLDANGDGIRDLAIGTVTGYDTGGLSVYLGNGTGGAGNGTFGPPTTYMSSVDTYQIQAADLDHDGRADLIAMPYLRDYISILPATCAPSPADPNRPLLTQVRDVSHDEGGRVFVTWQASALDATGGSVNGYRVWRRIPSAQAAAPRSEPAGLLLRVLPMTSADGSQALTYWEALATLPAERLAGYGYTAATTADSSQDGIPWQAFFVTALTANIDVFYESNVDSGYSVDNLAPPAPPGLVLVATAGPGFALHWLPDAANDLRGYRLYRGEVDGFLPSPGNLVAELSDTGYVDAMPGFHAYKLSALDVHGNESAFASVSTPATTGIGAGRPGLALRGAQPNPSGTGELRIAFELPRGEPAELRLVDISGRTVLEHRLVSPTAGTQELALRGPRRLAPGVYLIRLTQGSRTAVAKVVIRD